MKLLSYRRAEIKLSDHRPVTATYAAEVEVFSPKKLQRALTFTDAEIENDESIADMGIEVGIGRLRLEEVSNFHTCIFLKVPIIFNIFYFHVVPELGFTRGKVFPQPIKAPNPDEARIWISLVEYQEVFTNMLAGTFEGASL